MVGFDRLHSRPAPEALLQSIVRLLGRPPICHGKIDGIVVDEGEADEIADTREIDPKQLGPASPLEMVNVRLYRRPVERPAPRNLKHQMKPPFSRPSKDYLRNRDEAFNRYRERSGIDFRGSNVSHPQSSPGSMHTRCTGLSS